MCILPGAEPIATLPLRAPLNEADEESRVRHELMLQASRTVAEHEARASERLVVTLTHNLSAYPDVLSFEMKLYRARHLMEIPSLRLQLAFGYSSRHAELAWGWDSILNYLRLQEGFERVFDMYVGGSKQEKAFMAAMKDLFIFWTSDELHQVKAFRFGGCYLEHALRAVTPVIEHSMTASTSAYLRSRFPSERMEWASLYLLEQGVRELSLRLTEHLRSNGWRSVLQRAMDQSSSDAMLLYRGAPLPVNLTYQLRAPFPQLLWEWTTLSTVASRFTGVYYGAAGVCCRVESLQLLETRLDDAIAKVPIASYSSYSNEFELLVVAELQIVAAAVVSRSGPRTGAQVNLSEETLDVLGAVEFALRDGFEDPVVVLLMSAEPMEVEVAEGKLARHCEKLWGREEASVPLYKVTKWQY